LHHRAAMAAHREFKWPWQVKPPPPPPQPTLVESLSTPRAIAAISSGAALLGLIYVALRRRRAAQPKEPSTSTVAKSIPGVLSVSVASFLLVTSFSVTMPFMQRRLDDFGCDALCRGGQTSLRSALNLVGATVIGRASDRFGRMPMLWLGLAATLLSIAINLGMDSVEGMWYAIVPTALLNQNFGVSKALLTDYVEAAGGSKADLAGAVGKLGMCIGLSFMAGPLLATLLVTSYTQALTLSLLLAASSGVLLLLLPTTARKAEPKVAPDAVQRAMQPTPATPMSDARPAQRAPAPAAVAAGWRVQLSAFVEMPALRLRGAQLLLVLRLLMALAFHLYAPIWQVSIKRRFDFTPADHARFMGLIGLTYALSQGAVAKPLIRLFGRDSSRLLLLCVAVLGGFRPIALATPHLEVVYALYVPMVIALGVMNTAISTACSSLADGDQLGGLIGVLESVESVAGMVGPTLGGLLAAWHDGLPLAMVLVCYGTAFVLISLFYRKHVLEGAEKKAAAQKKAQ